MVCTAHAPSVPNMGSGGGGGGKFAGNFRFSVWRRKLPPKFLIQFGAFPALGASPVAAKLPMSDGPAA